MADGWARTNGNVGVAIGTSGPAGTNMITGLYTAQADSIPMICITGQAVSQQAAPGGLPGGRHRRDRQAGRRSGRCRSRRPRRLPWIFREAFRIARSGRPGPVLIDLPLDVQKQEIEWDAAIDAPLPVTAVNPHLPRVERALDLLLAAERPLILAGGGVILGEASEELRELAEQLGVPVQVTLMGKGSIHEDHELFAGMAGIQTSQR